MILLNTGTQYLIAEKKVNGKRQDLQAVPLFSFYPLFIVLTLLT